MNVWLSITGLQLKLQVYAYSLVLFWHVLLIMPWRSGTGRQQAREQVQRYRRWLTACSIAINMTTPTSSTPPDQLPMRSEETWQGLNQNLWWQGPHILEMWETQKLVSSKSDYSWDHCVMMVMAHLYISQTFLCGLLWFYTQLRKRYNNLCT